MVFCVTLHISKTNNHKYIKVNLLQKKKKISHPQINLIMLRCRVTVFEDLQDEEVCVGEKNT